MKPWEGLSYGLALAALVSWPAGNAMAASVSGRASTVLEWFDDPEGDTVVPIFQYLQFNALDLGNKGYNFHFYGRVGDDLADKWAEAAKTELYFAYFDKKNFLTDNLDMRLGRQFISTTAGASLMDGLRVDYGFLDNYRLSIFGGGDVTFYEGYSLKNATWGAQIGGRFLNDLDLAFSYLAKWYEGLLSHELFGITGSVNWRMLYLYNETQYDNISQRLTYELAGAKIHPAGKWTLRGEYLYSMPLFSAQSIYSVFAVEQYQQALGEVTYNIRPDLKAFGRYTREIYEEFSDANVFEAGIEKIRTKRISGYLSGVYRNDLQDLWGVKGRFAYLFNHMFEAGVGAEVDVLDRYVNYFTLEASDETTCSRIWLYGTVNLTSKTNIQAKVERIESDLWDYYYQGRVKLNILF
jgi:hypothetical protein